jgi:hypothetical protein
MRGWTILIVLAGIFNAHVNAASFQKGRAGFLNSNRILAEEILTIENGEQTGDNRVLETGDVKNRSENYNHSAKVIFRKLQQTSPVFEGEKSVVQNRYSEQQDVISILEVIKKEVLNLLEDEQVDDIKQITKELNDKPNQLNAKINKIQQRSGNIFLLDSLSFHDGNIGGKGFQAEFLSSVSKKQPLLNNDFMIESQMNAGNSTMEVPDGILGFILKIPGFILNLNNFFVLSFVVFAVLGLLKAIKFFLNNAW